MASITPDWTIPKQGAGRYSDLDHIRDHQQIALAAGALAADALVIGWDLISTVRNSNGYPTVRTYTHTGTGYQIRITKIYLGEFLEDVIYEANTGSGFEYFSPPKLDNVYSGNSLLSHTQWVQL